MTIIRDNDINISETDEAGHPLQSVDIVSLSTWPHPNPETSETDDCRFHRPPPATVSAAKKKHSAIKYVIPGIVTLTGVGTVITIAVFLTTRSPKSIVCQPTPGGSATYNRDDLGNEPLKKPLARMASFGCIDNLYLLTPSTIHPPVTIDMTTTELARKLPIVQLISTSSIIELMMAGWRCGTMTNQLIEPRKLKKPGPHDFIGICDLIDDSKSEEVLCNAEKLKNLLKINMVNLGQNADKVDKNAALINDAIKSYEGNYDLDKHLAIVLNTWLDCSIQLSPFVSQIEECFDYTSRSNMSNDFLKSRMEYRNGKWTKRLANLRKDKDRITFEDINTYYTIEFTKKQLDFIREDKLDQLLHILQTLYEVAFNGCSHANSVEIMRNDLIRSIYGAFAIDKCPINKIDLDGEVAYCLETTSFDNCSQLNTNPLMEKSIQYFTEASKVMQPFFTVRPTLNR